MDQFCTVLETFMPVHSILQHNNMIFHDESKIMVNNIKVIKM